MPMTTTTMTGLPTFADRIRFRREQLGLTQEQLAEEVIKHLPRGIRFNRVTISNIELGMQNSLKDKVFLCICRALRCRGEWLAFGNGPIEDAEFTGAVERKIPEVTWGKALTWLESPGVNGDTNHIAPVPCSDISFALRINSESMLPRFEINDLIFVDPELTELTNGKFVVIGIGSSTEATLKQVQIIDGKVVLRVLNPDYPPELKYISMSPDITVIGTVVAHMKPV